jgi:hypothetical protein
METQKPAFDELFNLKKKFPSLHVAGLNPRELLDDFQPPKKDALNKAFLEYRAWRRMVRRVHVDNNTMK